LADLKNGQGKGRSYVRLQGSVAQRGRMKEQATGRDNSKPREKGGGTSQGKENNNFRVQTQ